MGRDESDVLQRICCVMMKLMMVILSKGSDDDLYDIKVTMITYPTKGDDGDLYDKNHNSNDLYDKRSLTTTMTYATKRQCPVQ